MRKFEETSAFPKIIGAIDGTHGKIQAPKENLVDYINRKGFYSIQRQVVCDHRSLIITHCYVGHSGSLHQRVFRQSEVFGYLNKENKFPCDSHLVGDMAYELHKHLLVPFKDNGHLTVAQKNYNFCLSSARVVVKRCFALLKERMRSLLDCLPMMRIDLILEYVICKCCVIHNICMLHRDKLTILTVSDVTNDLVADYCVQRQAGTIQDTYKRNMIMNILQRRIH